MAFNDPASQPDGGMQATPAPAKKTNKNTLIALIVVVILIVIGLAAVLLLQLMGSEGGSTSNSGSSSSQNSTVADDTDTNTNANANTNTNTNANTVTPTTPTIGKVLNCERAMTATEVSENTSATSGTISVMVEFDTTDVLATVSLTKKYVGVDADEESIVKEETIDSSIDYLTPISAESFYLPIDGTGALETTYEEIEANYEVLDFICDVS